MIKRFMSKIGAKLLAPFVSKEVKDAVAASLKREESILKDDPMSLRMPPRYLSRKHYARGKSGNQQGHKSHRGAYFWPIHMQWGFKDRQSYVEASAKYHLAKAARRHFNAPAL